MIDHKSLARVEIKDADRGEVVAVFATLETLDSDGDITKKGAFPDGAPVPISAYGHTSWDGSLPVGQGVIREKGNEAILEGTFFLDTTAGRDTFSVVKRLGDAGLQEFSYGYEPVKFSYGEEDGRTVRYLEQLKVFEVSPVLVGAGVGTRLLSAKSGSPKKFEEHLTAVVTEVEALLERSEEVVTFRTAQGKSRLSAPSVEGIDRLDGLLKRLVALRDGPDDHNDPSDEVEALYARFVALNTQGA